MVNPTQASHITQSGLSQGKMSVESVVEEFCTRSDRLGDKDAGNVEPKLLNSVQKTFRQFSDERRKTKMLQYIVRTSKEDRGKTLGRYTVSWFNLHRIVVDDTELHRYWMLRVILKSLEDCDITIHSFIPVYNEFNGQITKCSSDTLVTLLEEIQNNIEQTACFLSTRWKDCVVVIFKHLMISPRITVRGTVFHGREYASDILLNWFARCGSETVFQLLLDVSNSTGLSHLISKYVTTQVLDGLQDNDLRSSLSWKSVCMMEFIEPKMLNRVLRALCTVWPQTNDSQSEEVLPSIRLMAKIFNSTPLVSKTFSNIFKNDRSLVLRSQFGFLAVIALCGVDRYNVAALADFKKTVSRLFKFFEEHLIYGWIMHNEENCVIKAVEKMTEGALTILKQCNKETWNLLGEPLYRIAKSLLECSASKEVTVIDGRVADGCRLWMYAKNVMKECLLNSCCAVQDHLISLIHFLSGVSNIGAALIVIDVIHDLVKFCSVAILNNWTLLEGIFEFVCGLRTDIAVSLIRSLFPVILHRSQLRRALFETIKRDLLRESTVGTSIPILLLVLKSTSQRTNLSVSQGQMSQSFASFSTQELDNIGVRRAVDETLGLEILGVLKRCMSLSANTQSVLYQGMAEIAEKNTSMILPCLDLLLPRATSLLATLTPETMVIATKSFTQLKQPLPQLIQSIECLMCSAMAASEKSEDLSERYDSLVNRGNTLIADWVKKAIQDDIHDLGVDKLSEWNPNSTEGRSNLVFSHMMLSYYDILIEHIWRRVAVLDLTDDRDSLVGILKRRREMEEVLNEKVVRRKEAKGSTVNASVVDLSQGEIFISVSTIAQVLLRMVPMEADISNIEEVKEDMFGWVIDRAYNIGNSLIMVNHPLHSLISSTNNLIIIASQMMDFHTGTDCAAWLRTLDVSESLRTKALETYTNILQYLAVKYGKNPSRIVSIWHHVDTGDLTQNPVVNTNSTIVRHVHKLITKVYPRLLMVEEMNYKEKTKTIDMENQSKAILKASSALLELSSSKKTYSTAFDFTMKMLKDSTFVNTHMLKDILHFATNLAVRAIVKDDSIARMMNMLADECIQTFSDEDEELKFGFITTATQTSVCNFLIAYIEILLNSIKSYVSMEDEFGTKDSRLDDALCSLLEKCDECCELVSRLHLVHTQFHQQKEKIVKMLTSFFSALETPVELLLSNAKIYPEIEEWKCVTALSTILKKKMQPIMAIVDEKVGILSAEDGARSTLKARMQKSRRDEGVYVKYVKARESFQSKVLLLCNALKDDRLNLQIKNNSIGFRDFRIDVRVLNEKLNAQTHDDCTLTARPAKRKRKSEVGPVEEEPADENMHNATEDEPGSAVY